MSLWGLSGLVSGRTPWLIPILLVALIPRIYWATTHTAVIENEGAVYASLAQNLLDGKGYVAVLGTDTFLNFPPLYPFLIAAVSPLAGEAERAARVVSVIAGTLVIAPVYFVALTLYGPVVARIAALLFALHPLLIGYSAAVYVEPTYLLFLLLGLYYALRAQELDSYVPSAVAGLAFGLAYLAKVEAAILPLATALLIVIPNWRRPRRAVIASGVLFASFLIVASPYILFLWTQTGSIRLEAKSPVFFLLLRRMTSGLGYLEAAYGLDPDLRESGPFLQPWMSIVQSTTYSISDVIGYLATTGRSRLMSIFTALTGRHIGSSLLIMLVILGLLRSPWDRARIVREALLLTILGAVIGSLLMTQWPPTRYLLPPLAFLLVWAAKGIQELADWMHGTCLSVFTAARSITASVRGAQALVMAMLLLVALTGARWEPELVQGLASERTTKEAGLWLRNTAPGPKMIMDVSSVFAFYAGGTHLYLPYCDAETALRYFAKKKPDFIVLSSHTGALRPYLREWIEAGIPDEHATLVYSRPRPDGGKIIVYRWEPLTRPGTGLELHPSPMPRSIGLTVVASSDHAASDSTLQRATVGTSHRTVVTGATHGRSH